MAAAVKGEGTVLEQQPKDASSSEQQPKDASSSESKTEVTAGDTPYTSAKTFEELNLSRELFRGLRFEMGFEKPRKIQARSLPMILTPPYQNLIAQAPIGHGKTTCFALGMLSRVDPKIAAPQALCVCPTKEIARKNQEVLMKMGKHTGITLVCTVQTGTGNYGSPSRRVSVTDQVVIGTPGTVKKSITNKCLSTIDIKILVFDEADQMLAVDGFPDDCRRIIKKIEKERAKIPQVEPQDVSQRIKNQIQEEKDGRQDGFQDDSLRIRKDIQKNRDGCQILFFSATYDENVKKFTNKVIPEAKQVSVTKEELYLDVIKQYVVKCPDELAKVEVIKDKIFPLAEKLGHSIIFVGTRENARMLHDKLEVEGYKCTSIYGGLELDNRDRLINEFSTGLTSILISTDVLARDQAQVTMVVNYDLPIKDSHPFDPDYEVYLHRIGRSARVGHKEVAFNFICTDRDEQTMSKIERYFQLQVPKVTWNSEDAFEAVFKDAGLA